MRIRLSMVLAVALLCLAPTVGQAQLAPYSQDFETLDPAPAPADGSGSLAMDGWLAFVNVFDPTGSAVIGFYGPFPTAQGGPSFAGVAGGQGGPDQGNQQMAVYSDYGNGFDHPLGNILETNVFQEQIVGALDVGNTWLFSFDAKRGNINENPGDMSTAFAFIKTLDPNNGFALTNFITIDTTNLPIDWDRYTLSILIGASLEGQILQFGFLTEATFFQPSANFYDNITFEPIEDCPEPGGDDEDDDSDSSDSDSDSSDDDSSDSTSHWRERTPWAEGQRGANRPGVTPQKLRPSFD